MSCYVSYSTRKQTSREPDRLSPQGRGIVATKLLRPFSSPTVSPLVDLIEDVDDHFEGIVRAGHLLHVQIDVRYALH